MSSIGEGREGGGVRGGFDFLGTPSRILLGHFPEIIFIYLESSAQASRLAPFLIKLGKRGGLWTFSKVGGTRTRCRPQGESSQ